MNNILDAKVAIIIETASDIGPATVEYFLSKGARAFAVDRKGFNLPEPAYALNNSKSAHGDVSCRSTCPAQTSWRRNCEFNLNNVTCDLRSSNVLVG